MLRTTLKKLIYPRGKVHKNYGKYVGWSCFSNFIISIESVLSTHSMLSVVGQASTELTLSVNYIGKDIVGQIGGLYYMNKMGEKADKELYGFPTGFCIYGMCHTYASDLDVHPSRWFSQCREEYCIYCSNASKCKDHCYFNRRQQCW